MLGRKEIGEMTTYKKQKEKGFSAIVALISFASFVLPGVALGVSDGDNMAVFDGSGSAVQRASPLGFGGVEVRVEQSSPPPTVESEKPAKTRRYVQPHWVDGGYGVEILVPGYSIGSENETRR
jgi:hypothetical protein